MTEYGLHLEIFFKSKNPELAPIAGLLVAAERQAAVERRAVEIDAPGADTVGNGTRALKIPGLHEDRRTFRLSLSQEGAKEFGRMARRHEEWVIALIGELSPVAQSDLLQHLTLLKRRLDKHA